MNERIRELKNKTLDKHFSYTWTTMNYDDVNRFAEKFAELIIQDCIDKIETYRIPVGNSASGELACEWTYDALKEIRDDIKEHFGINDRGQ